MSKSLLAGGSDNEHRHGYREDVARRADMKTRLPSPVGLALRKVTGVVGLN